MDAGNDRPIKGTLFKVPDFYPHSCVPGKLPKDCRRRPRPKYSKTSKHRDQMWFDYPAIAQPTVDILTRT